MIKKKLPVKEILVAMCLLIQAQYGHADGAQATEPDTQVSNAKAAIQALGAALKTELSAAIQNGGPVAAIGVCNERAMPITHAIATQQGVQLGRVSLKNRNPLNAPNEWQKTVLESFEERTAAGQDVASLTWSETAEVDGGQEFRFMKAIPTAGMCLVCHGADLGPDVSQSLAAHYPEDQATGFSVGDIRGAFVVTRVISD